MIDFDAVSLRYAGAPRAALDGVSLTAERGRVTAVVGPNGSGKSSLVRALLRTQPLAAGGIRVDGVALREIDRRALARRVAIVPQREELAFPLPVREYVALGRFPHEGRWNTDAHATDAAVEGALDLAGIGALAGRTTTALSGGEWQRTRIARALAQNAAALVLDEPTTFLDVAHEMAIFELLAAQARTGRAVLVISHQLNLVARFADVMVLLHAGRVVADGAPDEVMRADILERAYEWPLVITRDPAVGAPALLPLRARRPPTPHPRETK